MTRAITILILTLSVLTSKAQSKVISHISNFENNKGLCRVCLFSSAAAYANKQPQQCINVPVSGNKAQVIFENVVPGTYAVFVFHDTNSNGKMDTNFLGIPKEGYGASGNKLPFAAAPKFDANKFAVPANASVTLSIKLRNL